MLKLNPSKLNSSILRWWPRLLPRSSMFPRRRFYDGRAITLVRISGGKADAARLSACLYGRVYPSINGEGFLLASYSGETAAMASFYVNEREHHIIVVVVAAVFAFLSPCAGVSKVQRNIPLIVGAKRVTRVTQAIITITVDRENKRRASRIRAPPLRPPSPLPASRPGIPAAAAAASVIRVARETANGLLPSRGRGPLINFRYSAICCHVVR